MISVAKYLILVASIPIYDWLMDKLDEFKQENGRSQEMIKALEAGFEKLKKYYIKSDDSYMYVITTSKFNFIFKNNFL